MDYPETHDLGASANQNRKYAVYGGTFDPIHIGHVILADSAVKECGIDRLIFMPAYISPFKQDSNVTEGIDRYRMIERVLGHNEAFRVSAYELARNGPSYTFETLVHWRRILGTEISFVLGLDSIVQLDAWYRGEEIIKNFPLITGRRPHTEDAVAMEKIEAFRTSYDADIRVLDMEPVDASSTEIRRLAGEGKKIGHLVLPEVEEYIIEHGLYRQVL